MGKDSNVNDSASDLEAPLLDHGLDAGVLADGSATPTHRSIIDGEDPLDFLEPQSACGGKCSNSGAVANLAVTAVGAGMLALPRAFATVGVGLGVGLFVAVCFLTYYSSSIIIRWSWRLKKQSYGEVVLSEFGLKGARALQSAIIIHVAGVMITYCIIVADMLVGSAPEYQGVLPTMLGRHDGPWFLTRAFVVGVLLVVLVLPMLISRDLTVVARYSRASVFMMLFLAGVIAALAGLAVAKGQAAKVQWLPDLKMMGEGTPFDVLTSVLSVVSVACLAFTCQFNLIPVHNSLENPELGNMLGITRKSIGLCAALYSTIALSGYVLFGEDTEGDVLKNLTIGFVGKLTSKQVAVWLINGIVVCNTFNLLVNFVLKVWAVRDNVAEMALGVPASHLATGPYYSLTFVLCLAAYCLSIVIPSIWILVSLVGSTACVTFSYIFPGALVLKSKEAADQGCGARTLAKGAIGLACTMAALSIFNTLTGRADMG